MKKVVYALFLGLVTVTTSACTDTQIIGIPNPWKDCLDNMECAKKVAGFEFPLTLSNYTIRAMKGVFEITYPLDEFRSVTVRKTFDETKGLDNSGDYTKYEKNGILTLSNGVDVHTRGNGNKINVMYFAAESGVYSARCEQGMSAKEAEGVFKVIADAESSKTP